nr:MFS transporter [Actinomadura fibrosa]
MREAADELLMRPNNVSALVSQLGGLGLLERRRDAADRRVAAARERLAEVRRVRSAHVTGAVRALTDGEMDALGSALGALSSLRHLHAPAGRSSGTRSSGPPAANRPRAEPHPARPLGGLLIEHVGWESVFFVNVPIGLAAPLFSALVLPRSRNAAAAGQRFDVPGVVLLALGLLAVVFGVVRGETWGWSSAATLGAIAAGLAVFALLGMIFFVMLYLQNVRGFSPVEAGVRTLPLSLASVAAAPLGAALTERFGPRFTMPLGMLLQAAACFLMLGWDAGSPFAAMWPPFVAGGLQASVLQIGGALGTSVLVSLIDSRVGATLYGELISAGVPASAARSLGEARDAVAMGVAPVSAGMPGDVRAAVVAGSGQAFMNGVHTAVLVTGMLCVLGAVLAAAGVRRRPAAH